MTLPGRWREPNPNLTPDAKVGRKREVNVKKAILNIVAMLSAFVCLMGCVAVGWLLAHPGVFTDASDMGKIRMVGVLGMLVLGGAAGALNNWNAARRAN